MGGGQYIGKDGKNSKLEYSTTNLELPAEVLPSEEYMDRVVDAVTIDDDLMDDDLRAALFDEEDNEGEFEELLDDFVIEVSNNYIYIRSNTMY